MLFNFPDRVLGQVLVYLGDDTCFDIGMECVSQIRKRSRRATTTRAFALLARTAATLRANRCSSIWCQSVGSTALLRPVAAGSATRPGSKDPAAYVLSNSRQGTTAKKIVAAREARTIHFDRGHQRDWSCTGEGMSAVTAPR